MNKKVSLAEISPIMTEMLEKGGEVRFTPNGRSMEPMLCSGRDVICLTDIREPLKKYDIPLFRRDNGMYVLHRIIKVEKDGTYDLAGDNQETIEKGISHSQCIGVLKGYWKEGKYIACTEWRYRTYCKIWVFLLPFRRLLKKCFYKLKTHL